MTVPYSLVLIKPMSVGRGHAPQILRDILQDCPVSLRMFKAWVICDTTLFAMTREVGPAISTLRYGHEQIHTMRQIPHWVCLFTHKDRVSDPTQKIMDYCGPALPKSWLNTHLRSRYTEKVMHPSDTVVHVADPERVSYEANLMFFDFDESQI